MCSNASGTSEIAVDPAHRRLVVPDHKSLAIGVGFFQTAGGFLIGLFFLLLGAAINFVFLLYVLCRTPRSSPAA